VENYDQDCQVAEVFLPLPFQLETNKLLVFDLSAINFTLLNALASLN